MSLKTKILGGVLLVAVLALLATAFTISQGKKDALKELEAIQAHADSLHGTISMLQDRIKADELFIGGKHDDAFAIYMNIAGRMNDPSITTRREEAIGRVNSIYREMEMSESKSVREASLMQELMNKSIEEKETWYRNTIDSMMVAHAKEVAFVKKLVAEKQQQLENVPKNSSLVFYSKNGTKTTYFGEVSNNKANGLGIGYYSTGNAYIGGWKDNLKHGQKCTFLWVDGDKYEGDYVNDRREGKGTYFWKNGDRYEGDWKEDKRNGYGVLYNYENEVKLRGEWKNDEFSKAIN